MEVVRRGSLGGAGFTRPPRELTVAGAGSCSGQYQLIDGRMCLELPVWVQIEGGAHIIFSNQVGRWTIGEEITFDRDFEAGTGKYLTKRRHEGSWPHEILPAFWLELHEAKGVWKQSHAGFKVNAPLESRVQEAAVEDSPQYEYDRRQSTQEKKRAIPSMFRAAGPATVDTQDGSSPDWGDKDSGPVVGRIASLYQGFTDAPVQKDARKEKDDKRKRFDATADTPATTSGQQKQQAAKPQQAAGEAAAMSGTKSARFASRPSDGWPDPTPVLRADGGTAKMSPIQSMQSMRRVSTGSEESVDDTLPAGWARFQDAEGRTYYGNPTTGESSWDPPEVVVEHDKTREKLDKQLTRAVSRIITGAALGQQASLSSADAMKFNDTLLKTVKEVVKDELKTITSEGDAPTTVRAMSSTKSGRAMKATLSSKDAMRGMASTTGLSGADVPDVMMRARSEKPAPVQTLKWGRIGSRGAGRMGGGAGRLPLEVQSEKLDDETVRFEERLIELQLQLFEDVLRLRLAEGLAGGQPLSEEKLRQQMATLNPAELLRELQARHTSSGSPSLSVRQLPGDGSSEAAATYQSNTPRARSRGLSPQGYEQELLEERSSSAAFRFDAGALPIGGGEGGRLESDSVLVGEAGLPPPFDTATSERRARQIVDEDSDPYKQRTYPSINARAYATAARSWDAERYHSHSDGSEWLRQLAQHKAQLSSDNLPAADSLDPSSMAKAMHARLLGETTFYRYWQWRLESERSLAAMAATLPESGGDGDEGGVAAGRLPKSAAEIEEERLREAERYHEEQEEKARKRAEEERMRLLDIAQREEEARLRMEDEFNLKIEAARREFEEQQEAMRQEVLKKQEEQREALRGEAEGYQRRQQQLDLWEQRLEDLKRQREEQVRQEERWQQEREKAAAEKREAVQPRKSEPRRRMSEEDRLAAEQAAERVRKAEAAEEEHERLMQTRRQEQEGEVQKLDEDYAEQKRAMEQKFQGECAARAKEFDKWQTEVKKMHNACIAERQRMEDEIKLKEYQHEQQLKERKTKRDTFVAQFEKLKAAGTAQAKDHEKFQREQSKFASDIETVEKAVKKVRGEQNGDIARLEQEAENYEQKLRMKAEQYRKTVREYQSEHEQEQASAEERYGEEEAQLEADVQREEVQLQAKKAELRRQTTRTLELNTVGLENFQEERQRQRFKEEVLGAGDEASFAEERELVPILEEPQETDAERKRREARQKALEKIAAEEAKMLQRVEQQKAQPDYGLLTGEPIQIRVQVDEETFELGFEAPDRRPLQQDVEVVKVVPGGFAEQSGIQVGDTLIEIDGEEVAVLSADDVALAMQPRPLTLLFSRPSSWQREMLSKQEQLKEEQYEELEAQEAEAETRQAAFAAQVGDMREQFKQDMRVLRKTQDQAALILQTRIRGVLVIKRMKKLAASRDLQVGAAVQHLQNAIRKKQAVVLAEDKTTKRAQDEAASTIQKYARANLAKREARGIESGELAGARHQRRLEKEAAWQRKSKHDAAALIQSRYRGKQERRRHEASLPRNLEKQRQEEATLVIQAHARKSLQLADTRERQEQRRDVAKADGAAVIQRRYRASLAKSGAQDKRQETRERPAAACQIEAALLTLYAVQESYPKLRAATEERRRLRWEAAAEQSAGTIQRVWRGRQARCMTAAMQQRAAGTAPEAYYVTAPELCAGRYAMLAETSVNGMPIWKLEAAHIRWLFSSPDGRWLIGDEDEAAVDFQATVGRIASRVEHRGVMPHAVKKWERLHLDGSRRIADDTILVTRSRIPPPELLRVIAPGTCAGMYSLLTDQMPNGFPLWKHQSLGYWLFSGLSGQWIIGDEDDAGAGFAGDTGYVASSQEHGGRMPHRLGEDGGLGMWLLFGHGGWQSGCAVQVFSQDAGGQRQARRAARHAGPAAAAAAVVPGEPPGRMRSEEATEFGADIARSRAELREKIAISRDAVSKVALQHRRAKEDAARLERDLMALRVEASGSPTPLDVPVIPCLACQDNGQRLQSLTSSLAQLCDALLPDADRRAALQELFAALRSSASVDAQVGELAAYLQRKLRERAADAEVLHALYEQRMEAAETQNSLLVQTIRQQEEELAASTRTLQSVQRAWLTGEERFVPGATE
eukprot:TRINITY_DN10670_c0_g1_i1.p1 TRINITY_DN10670_c0_g1~~TRINITY_DN10670_c0_g1_i1.p1  ORF type:complete len:2123 (+),score=588.44 TRINITY_DN10670_c0_g1_i1:301-6669(+)